MYFLHDVIRSRFYLISFVNDCGPVVSRIMSVIITSVDIIIMRENEHTIETLFTKRDGQT